MPMPDGAARALAAALHERGEHLGGANGALPGAEVLARATAELSGGELVVDKATRLWECTSVEVPPAPEGRLRRATEADAELVLAWFTAFHEEADEQAGREPDPTSGEHNTLDSVLVRIREGVEWLWELPDGTPAHLTGAGLPSYGVSRIGPVFTPKELRGRGIASYVVGELTRRGLESGHRMCLFTDRANPTSNKVYAALGYEPTVDMAEHVVGLPGGESSRRGADRGELALVAGLADERVDQAEHQRGDAEHQQDRRPLVRVAVLVGADHRGGAQRGLGHLVEPLELGRRDGVTGPLGRGRAVLPRRERERLVIDDGGDELLVRRRVGPVELGGDPGPGHRLVLRRRVLLAELRHQGRGQAAAAAIDGERLHRPALGAGHRRDVRRQRRFRHGARLSRS
jgi:hypothetical protein